MKKKQIKDVIELCESEIAVLNDNIKSAKRNEDWCSLTEYIVQRDTYQFILNWLE